MILLQNKQSTSTQNTQNQASNGIFCKSERFSTAKQSANHTKYKMQKRKRTVSVFLYVILHKIDILSIYFALFDYFQAKSRMPNNRLAAFHSIFKFEISQPWMSDCMIFFMQLTMIFLSSGISLNLL